MSPPRPNRFRLLARSWWTARTQMADLALEMTRGRCSLAELQGSALIALELDRAPRPVSSVTIINGRMP